MDPLLIEGFRFENIPHMSAKITLSRSKRILESDWPHLVSHRNSQPDPRISRVSRWLAIVVLDAPKVARVGTLSLLPGVVARSEDGLLNLVVSHGVDNATTAERLRRSPVAK